MTISKKEKVKQSSAMNLIERLKGVPRGTKLYSPAFGDVIFEEIRQDYIRVKTINIIREFYFDGRYYTNGECMLFPSREDRDWSTFKVYPFKEGDILIAKSEKPFIFKEAKGKLCAIYCGIDTSDTFWKHSDKWTYLSEVRKATEKEIDLFFERLRKEGYKWNPETFNLEKIEKFNITTLKPFDKVLVRDSDASDWYCEFYSHYRSESHYKYCCTSTAFYQCIPYNDDTKHLVGTKEPCPEYYKNW